MTTEVDEPSIFHFSAVSNHTLSKEQLHSLLLTVGIRFPVKFLIFLPASAMNVSRISRFRNRFFPPEHPCITIIIIP